MVVDDRECEPTNTKKERSILGDQTQQAPATADLVTWDRVQGRFLAQKCQVSDGSSSISSTTSGLLLGIDHD